MFFVMMEMMDEVVCAVEAVMWKRGFSLPLLLPLLLLYILFQLPIPLV